MHAVKVYEQLTIEAAITGDRGTAAGASASSAGAVRDRSEAAPMKCWRRTKVLAGFFAGGCAVRRNEAQTCDYDIEPCKAPLRN